jgi:hypothetical protein
LKQALSDILYGTPHDLGLHCEHQDICDAGRIGIVGTGLYRKILGKRPSDAVIRVRDNHAFGCYAGFDQSTDQASCHIAATN